MSSAQIFYLPSGWRWPLAVSAVSLLVVAAAGSLEDQWQQEWAKAEHAEKARREADRRTAAAAVQQPTGWPSLLTALPGESDRDQRIAALVQAAEQRRLVLQRVELEPSAHPSSKLTEWHVRLILRGDYRALREFVEVALAEDLASSLDRLQMRRASIDQEELVAELGWTLLARRTEDTP